MPPRASSSRSSRPGSENLPRWASASSSSIRNMQRVQTPAAFSSAPHCPQRWSAVTGVGEGVFMAPSDSCRRLQSPAQVGGGRTSHSGHPDMGWKAHATWHGLSSPWVCGGVQKVRCARGDFERKYSVDSVGAGLCFAPFMKVVSSIKSAKKRHPACQVVRRKGKIYVINKVEPRYKARQG